MNILSSLASAAADFRHESLANPALDAPEPLVRISDLAEFRHGFAQYRKGAWSAERWTTLRLRFGVYAQRQNGQHMLRVKIPGGRLSFAQARALAAANHDYAGSSIHFTTRQAAQLYFLPFDKLPEILADLATGGLTTREAAGNTFRNVTSCSFAGICPRERVDAGAVAERLTIAWLRDPLVQHMPRKFKTTVSGCATDCGASAFDDLGLIAVERDGHAGFRVLAGGGLGAQPQSGVVILDFVAEQDIPAMQEALARVHQRYSNRKKKMASRIKFLVERFGAQDFAARVRAEFEAVRTLPRRPWLPLHWRAPTPDMSVPNSGDGRWLQSDGTVAVIARLPLGMIDSKQLADLATFAKAHGAREFRAMCDQNLLVVGIPAEKENDFVAVAQALRLNVATRTQGIGELVACSGTITCPIGITNSNGLANSLLSDPAFGHLLPTRVRISGCPNSCGQHHLGDFGLHGLSKKVDGRPAPHYQIHLGGNPTDAAGTAIEGPIVSARQAKVALAILVDNFHSNRKPGESVRTWARRLGKDGIEALLAPLRVMPVPPDIHTDIGDSLPFRPPHSMVAECAASATAAEYLSDLAEAARRDVARWNAIGKADQARSAAHESVLQAGRRLLDVDGIDLSHLADGDIVVKIGAQHPDLAPLLQKTIAVTASGGMELLDTALAAWIGEIDRQIEAKLATISAKPI